MRILFTLFVLLVFCKASALAPPFGAGGVPPLNPANAGLSAAAKEIFQYGPGVWSNPGLATLSEEVFITQANLLLAAPTSSGLNINPLFDATAPLLWMRDLDIEVPAGNFVLNPTHYSLNRFSPRDADPGYDYGQGAILGRSLDAPLALILGLTGAQALAGPPIKILSVPHTAGNYRIIKLGLFNSNHIQDNVAIDTWVDEYLALYGFLLNANGNTNFVDTRSRGFFFLRNLNEARAIADAVERRYKYRQILHRHNQATASYRAIGLNPMWAYGNPTSSGGFGPNRFQVPDYILNSTSRFFYREGRRHKDPGGAMNELSLIYRIFASMLSYKSGHMNTRLESLDPSCRNPVGNTCAPTVIPQVFLDNPHRIHMGSASDFAVTYTALNYLLDTQADAAAMANNIGAVSAAVNARLGVGMPTDIPTLVALAQRIFDRAWEDWTNHAYLPGDANFLAPRVSAAFVAAAAMVGKRVDPIFWGYLAEAEQAVFKNSNRATYKAFADGIFVDSTYINEYGLSLSDFGTYRAVRFTPAMYVDAATLTFTNIGLTNLFNAARVGGQMSLVRGPDGLLGLQAEKFDVASAYKDTANIFQTNLFPNAYIELNQSRRSIIDGNILFSVADGQARFLDIDYTLRQGVAFPYEDEVLRSYAADATIVLAGSNVAINQADYKEQTGSFKPLTDNISDSRYFMPALQFWLVVSDKLVSNGLDPLINNNPQQLKNIANMYHPELDRGNYRIKNIRTVQFTDSGTPRQDIAIPGLPAVQPLSNQLPLDGYKNYGFVGDGFSSLVVESFRRSLLAPYVSMTNEYLPGTTRAAADATNTTLTPDVPSGAGSMPCARANAFPNRDQSVNCP